MPSVLFNIVKNSQNKRKKVCKNLYTVATVKSQYNQPMIRQQHDEKNAIEEL